MRHGLSKFLTQGATQRLLRLLMMTKQMRLNAFAMNCVAHRPDRAIDRKNENLLPLTTVPSKDIANSRKL